MYSKEIPLALTYDDVLLVPQKTDIKSRLDVDLSTYITPKIKIKFPVVAINMDTVVGVDMARAMYNCGSLVFYPRFKSIKDTIEDIKILLSEGVVFIPAVGVKESEYERAEVLIKAGCKVLTIDVAHGHMTSVIELTKKLSKNYPKVELVAGTIATYEAAKDLFDAGACTVRVGVGPGTICTTRQVTGCGVPNITATLEAYEAAKKFSGIVVTDGGTKNSGDIVKGLAAGANVHVVGSQIAGSEECPGPIVEINGKKYKGYNGNTSKKEKEAQYERDKTDKHDKYIDFIEGVESFVPYKGPVKSVLAKLEPGIRSGFTYCNARNINELHKNAQFIRVSPISVVENGYHGVMPVSD
jgi:IMP dehydrogenase